MRMWMYRWSPTCRVLHASLTRDTEGYVLEAVRPIQVNGRRV